MPRSLYFLVPAAFGGIAFLLAGANVGWLAVLSGAALAVGVAIQWHDDELGSSGSTDLDTEDSNAADEDTTADRPWAGPAREYRPVFVPGRRLKLVPEAEQCHTPPPSPARPRPRSA